ncbi:MAG: cbb3-type cytochrome c oxidase subunit I [Nitrospirae bacterium]|nr:cbb3-type cytochrome c oxidase subunit I [Nitrospirota bacterium]
MELIIVWYLRMSIIYFVAGAGIGIMMILEPSTAGHYVTSHAHLNLLGFMSMMIYGVGYHILPKFSGRHIYSSRIMHIQFWLANAGLIGLAAGWPLRAGGNAADAAASLLIISAAVTVGSVVLFAVNILKTVKAVQM